jgi:predicted metal-binding protein
VTRIAILTCGNVKNDLSCSAAGCFRSFNERDGEFIRYKDDKELQIGGLSSCAGCPTRLAPEKLLNKVKPLVELSGAEKIHFSSCMIHLCPFINKYKTVIGSKYPDVELIMGTDPTPDALLKNLGGMVKKLLVDDMPDLTEEIKKITATE